MSSVELSSPARRSRRIRRLAVDLLVYALLLLGVLSVILPFVYMLASSLEGPTQISALTPQFIPNPLTWANYQQVWNDLPIARYFLNSAIVSLIITAAQLMTASMAAYAFARLQFRGRSTLFALYLGTLIIPSQV